MCTAMWRTETDAVGQIQFLAVRPPKLIFYLKLLCNGAMAQA